MLISPTNRYLVQAMTLIIHKLNISQYRKGLYTDIDSIDWCAGPLDPSVLINFPNLIELYCRGQSITSLRGIEVCTNLEILYVDDNLLTTLDYLEYCPKLVIIFSTNNRLVSIGALRNCPMLEALYVSHNRLPNLTGIEPCIRLRVLYCSHNCLTSIQPATSCLRLTTIDCSHNQLESVDYLSALNQLMESVYDGNPINSPAYVQRFKNISKRISNMSLSASASSVLMPTSSPLEDFVTNLLKQPIPDVTAAVIEASVLDPESKQRLMTYALDTTLHPSYPLTYGQVMGYMWRFIIVQNPTQSKIDAIVGHLRSIEGADTAARIELSLNFLMRFAELKTEPEVELVTKPMSKSASHRLNSFRKMITQS